MIFVRRTARPPLKTQQPAKKIPGPETPSAASPSIIHGPAARDVRTTRRGLPPQGEVHPRLRQLRRPDQRIIGRLLLPHLDLDFALEMCRLKWSKTQKNTKNHLKLKVKVLWNEAKGPPSLRKF